MYNFSSINLIITLLIVISVIGLGIYIQVKLTRSKNKYLGLIMPILSFLLSFIVLFNTKARTVGIEPSIDYLGVFYVFLIGNIPTIILGGIYLIERNRIDKENL